MSEEPRQQKPAAGRRPIRQLDPRMIERIAAGEVIERPGVGGQGVGRERDRRRARGRSRSRCAAAARARSGSATTVAGIPADELALAFTRHATSKLRDADDLWRIGSLGFRGEALASIGAMGETLLISATDDSGEGAGVLVSDGRVVESFARARARGTTVTVRSLFADVPARLKFMRPARTESAQISALVRRYALARPGSPLPPRPRWPPVVRLRRRRRPGRRAGGDLTGGRSRGPWRHCRRSRRRGAHQRGDQRAATPPPESSSGRLLRQRPLGDAAQPGRGAGDGLSPLLPARAAPAGGDLHRDRRPTRSM